MENNSRCNDCPIAQMIDNQITDMKCESEDMSSQAMGEDIQDEMVELLLQMEDIEPAEARRLVAGDIGKFRQMVARMLDEMDDAIEHKQLKLDLLKYDCPGPLTMRARDHLGRMVTARVCGSQIHNEDDGMDDVVPEPVWVRRDFNS